MNKSISYLNLQKEKSIKFNFNLQKIVNYIFIFFCFIPFLFPNPIVNTNIQPYASILAIVVILLNYKVKIDMRRNYFSFILPLFTFLVAMVLMFISGVNIQVIRGVYNYYGMFIIPIATIIVLNKIGELPEKFIKLCILLWFFVGSVQFFIYRGFATSLISGVRWSFDYRGVIGLASEPSFYGIACFYFLNLITRFKTRKHIYMILTLIMGIFYAQSIIGIIFIASFYIIFLIDSTTTSHGLKLWVFTILLVFIGAYIFRNFMNTTRIYDIVQNAINNGINSILLDESASNRLDSIINAFREFAKNNFLPYGFDHRIGSAIGGVLVELGVFGIPAIIYLAKSLGMTFKRKLSFILYFIIVILLFLNNTQIGNPLLLFVIGVNIWDNQKKSLNYEIIKI